ncbi:hypothetical protein K1T71_008229 [Dendrolimus kikuchii]|uniref:Uncharacterized protein n=2 Tax=Dendrolimus kikuchii TaxID=765133 RepID=A0ACC1CWD4_9NEOP|nr:hypothetical protein K1T71_008198 [Dendrolimus kikuchii]KAJ0176055.1 hypothetical protein K1T71_008229 [Dendrolimus kikuchii]
MDLFAKLSSNMNELASTFDSRMNLMETELKKFSSGECTSHKNLDALSQDYLNFKNLIWKSLAIMRTQLELTFQGLDRQETASRRKVLLFHGIAESSDKTIEDSILQLLINNLKMTDFSLDNLSACHRLGINTSKPRPVMVRFSSYKDRHSAWNAKTLLKNTGITVSEFLTKSRHDLFTAARKHFGMRRCWTSEGKIIVLLPDNKRRRIETSAELKLLTMEFPTTQPASDEAPIGAEERGKINASAASKTNKFETKTRRGVK